MEKKSYHFVVFLSVLLTYSLVNGEEVGNRISLWLKAALLDLKTVDKHNPPSIRERTSDSAQTNSSESVEAIHPTIDPKIFMSRKRLLSWYFEPFNGNHTSSFAPFDINSVSYSQTLEQDKDPKEDEEFDELSSIKRSPHESTWEDEYSAIEYLEPDEGVLDQKYTKRKATVDPKYARVEPLAEEERLKKLEEDECARLRAEEENRKKKAEEESHKKAEAERLERERLEKERLEKERLEKERLEKERLEKERLEKERLEKERLEKERLKKEAEEAARKKAEEEAAALKKKAEEDERARVKAEEENRKKKAEEEARKKAEAERLEKERLKKEAEESARKKAEEEAARKKAEEEAARKKAEEERLKKLEEERLKRERIEKERLKKEAEEAARKKAEEEAAALKKKAEEDERARVKAEEERLKKLEEERLERERIEKERLKKEAEEAARKKAEEEAAALKKKAEEEVARKKAEEEARKKKAQEEAARKKAEEDERARVKAEEENRKKKAEEEARKKAEAERLEKERLKKEAEEAARKKAEEEAAALKKKAEEEVARKKADEEAARKKAEEEAARKKAEEEAARKKAEEEAARKKAEEEAARKKAEEEARKKKAEENERVRVKAVEEAARKKAEEERLKKLEEERLEKDRLKKERIEKERLEKERLEKERLEKERLEKERLEKERLKKEAEEAARKKKAEEDERVRVKAVEEAARKKAEEEAARKKADEEAARKKAEEEARKKKAEEDERAREKAEEEATQKKAEEEAAIQKKKEEDETAAILAAQQLAAKAVQDAEVELKRQQEEDLRRAVELQEELKHALDSSAKATNDKGKEERDEKDGDNLAAMLRTSSPQLGNISGLPLHVPEPPRYINTSWLTKFVGFIEAIQETILDDISNHQKQLRELKKQQDILTTSHQDSLTQAKSLISKLEAKIRDHTIEHQKIARRVAEQQEKTTTKLAYTEDLFDSIARHFGALKKVIVDHRVKLEQAKDTATRELTSAHETIDKTRTEIIKSKAGLSSLEEKSQQLRTTHDQLTRDLDILRRTYTESFDHLQETLTTHLQQMVRGTLSHPQKDEFWPIYVELLQQVAIKLTALPKDEEVKDQAHAFFAGLLDLEIGKAGAQLDLLINCLPDIDKHRALFLGELNTIFEKKNEIQKSAAKLKTVEERQQLLQIEYQKVNERLAMYNTQEKDFIADAKRLETQVTMKNAQFTDFLESTKLLTEQEELKDPTHLVGLASVLPQAPQSPTKKSIFVLMKDYDRAQSDLQNSQDALWEQQGRLEAMKQEDRELQEKLQELHENRGLLQKESNDKIKPIEQSIAEHHQMLEQFRRTGLLLRDLSSSVNDALMEFAQGIPMPVYETTLRAYRSKVEELDTYFLPSGQLSIISEQYQRWKSQQQADLPLETELHKRGDLTLRQRQKSDVDDDSYLHERSMKDSTPSLADELALVNNGSAGTL